MSLKNLFSKVGSRHVLSDLNINSLTDDVESGRYIDEYIKRKIRFEPHVDYATASNFAKFGLAEEYYDAAIKRIHQTYPYDGSSYEKIKWVNECNGLDLHVLENGYPRSHGYAKFSPSGWGSRTSASGSYGNPTTKEYIYIKGGPNIDNIWNTASNRTSNLEIDGNKGNTVEFWLKKSAYQSLTKREVIFDAWTTGSYVGEHNYGRLTIELDSTNSEENSPWIITYRSGSAGIKNLFVSGASGLYASASDGNWHHYAFTFQNTGSQVSYRMYVDGNLNHSVLTGSSIGNLNTAMVATIGSLAAGKDEGQKGRESAETVNPGLGYGKLSGSVDEFRFWKTRRSARDIGRHWFTQVHGGTNTDESNTDLGVYYKFNEGITLTSSIDDIVLDYSGRVTNGNWVGYSTGARSVKSAMIQSSASLTEFADPIIHTENPKVNKYMDDMQKFGNEHDINSNSCIYHSFPGWILEDEDREGGELKRLSQIMGSYFDTLFFQIESLAKLKHIKNEDYDKKPNPFMDKVLASVGFETPEIFIDADVLASLASRDEEKEFEQRLEDVKNVIYRNIYNNLAHIYKAKGTEKAFRNLLRCYGIDHELIKINTYADKVDFPVEQNYRVGSYKTKCINFNRVENAKATVFQYSSSFGRASKSTEFPVSGYLTGAHANDPSVGLSFTTEAEIVFPHRHKFGSKLFHETPISSSLFGAHTVLDSHGGSHDLTWKAAAKDFANFEVYAVKNRRGSRNAKFVIKSRSGVISAMETDIFYDVYDGNKWNFAVRVAPRGTYGSTITGSTGAYNLEFYGVRTDAGETKKEFFLTSSLTTAQGERFHQYSKRLYVGAHRENFTGGVQTLSDVQFSSLRHWLTYLDNDTVKAHAIDPKSYGVPHPMRSAFTFQPGLDNPVPQIETLALSWDFATVSGSTTAGTFIVDDISSGSFTSKRDYGWVGDLIGSNHPGRGLFFPSDTTASVAVNYLQTARQQLPENVHSSNMINVPTNDDRTYTRESRPVNHFFAIEKSMYQTISEEMLDMFATIKDFSNIVGEPVNRYRPNYKSMEKLRQLFYERIENTPSIERYLEFYKWIDASLSIVLDQLKPASANFSEDVRTMIESHVLERNKYWTKYPTLDRKSNDSVEPGLVKSVNELFYNWKFGHAPVSSVPNLKASATVTISSVGNVEFGAAVSVIATDGTTITATVGDSTTQTDTTSARFAIVSGSAANTAANLAICLNANSRLTASAASNVVTIKQLEAGSAGNTTISLTDTGDAGLSTTSFSGGSQRRHQNENCLWWKQRAEAKDEPLTSGRSDVDADRKTLNRVIHAQISSSTYSLRALTRPYRLQVELEPVIHGGSNFHLNKKKDFYLSTTNPNATDYIRVSGSDVDFGPECKDVYHPRYGNGLGSNVFEKKKVRAAADISSTGNDHDVDMIAPFSLYSSSIDVPVDYKSEIYRHFKKSVDITNLHSDAYGDDREIPIQSPFTEHWVGGHEHRHQHLNIMRPKIPQADPGLQNITMSLDHAGRRFEAFHITMSHGQLYVTSPNMTTNFVGGGVHRHIISLTASNHNRSRVLREPLAKRPVNIRNIQTTASEYAKDTVLNIGNYKHSYEIVQGTSVEMSPVFLVRTGSIEPVETTSNSPFFIEINERRKFARPKRKNVFVNRFSSPGGPETAGDSLGGPGLDIATNQYSVYSTLNYRNMMPRFALNEWATDRTGQFGVAHNSSVSSSNITASYHKVNRNPRYVATASAEATASPVSSSGDEIRPKYDNQFVQHQIPQSDLGYAWIRASTIETTASYNRLESTFTYPKAQSDETVFQTNLASAVDYDSPRFVSASERGLRDLSANRLLSYGDRHALTNQPDPGTPTDFVGLNSVIYEHISQSNNTLGGLAPIDSLGGLLTSSIEPNKKRYTLNHILLNRGSIHGYPSWKQIRSGEHPIARKLRKDNIFTLAVERDNLRASSFSPAPFVKGNYSWPENIDHKMSRTSRTVSSQRYRFTESAVTSKFKPLKTADIVSVIAGAARPYGSFRAASDSKSPGKDFIVAKRVTYGNDLTSFSNPDLVKLLQISEKEKAKSIRSIVDLATLQTSYTETIYPRDSNSYSNRVRGRENFAIDWWKPKRADRRTIDKKNSQGLHIGITSSMWPLDAQPNFGTSNEIALGTDLPGADGSGELMSAYGLFRSSSVGLHSYPSASATYARRFPEENYVFNLTFNTTTVEEYWGTAGSGQSTIYYVAVYPPEASAVVRYLYFCRTAETASVNNSAAIEEGSNKLWVPLSESSYTTTTLASAVKDAWNSSRSAIKDIARASSSGNKLSLHFYGTWDNSYIAGDYLGDEYANTTNNAQFLIANLNKGPVFLSASSNTSTYLAGAAKWEAGDQSGRYPFNYDNYEDYALQMRMMGKDYSIIPEYRISEEMSNYVNRAAADPYFSCPQSDFLKMTGSDDDAYDSSKSDFFKVYGHSDFIKYFDVVKEGHDEIDMSPNSLTLRCKALKKFLPYKGVYPAQRTLQLATLFSQSYGPETDVTVENFGKTRIGNEPYGSWRTAMQPFFAPGIAYNSIKAGIAVDYPVFVPKLDRHFNMFCTAFNKQGTNYINIGQASEWAQLISGSHAKSAGSAAGLSISMWVWFEEDPDADSNNDTSGSLLVFKDNDSVTEGIHFTKHGGRLLFSMFNDASNYNRWWTKPYKSITTANQWYHLAVAKKLDGTAPDFYIDGVQIVTEGGSSYSGGTAPLTGSSGNLSETTVKMDGHASTATGNSTIGNHNAGHTATNHSLNAMEIMMAEVSIYNTKLTDKSVRGLYGGGTKGRGPWRPDLCVQQSQVDNLIGWFRMGNETGYVLAGTSGSVTMTNNLSMNNLAMPMYRSTLKPGGTGQLAGTQTATKGEFRGFVDAWSAGAQTGYGITKLGDNSVDSSFAMELTGAFMYPSHITGSAFNETADMSIPRLGSASWGQHMAEGADEELAGATSFWTQGDYLYDTGGDRWGVQRADRIPFETIIDPGRVLTKNKIQNIGVARNVTRQDERFVIYEMEPHPSASLQPCSFLRSLDSGSYDKEGALKNADSSTHFSEANWGAFYQTPVTSSMLTASFSLSKMRSLGDTEYSKASQNFFAESMNLFLDGGHTTTLSSRDTLQTSVDPSKTYKFKVRLSRPNTQDFPMYNRAAAFGPPLDAGPLSDTSNMSDNYFGHGFSAYTPPHYGNYAECEWTFSPKAGVKYDTIEDVIDQITMDNSLGTNTIKYNRYLQGTGSKNLAGYSGITNNDFISGETTGDLFGSVTAATASLNKTHAMQLSASFYGMDLSQGSLIPVFEGTERDKYILRKTWVMQTKWETPNMDFRGVGATKPKPHFLTTTKGMWHQTGAYDNPTSFLEILPPDDGSEDLSRLLGMRFVRAGIPIKGRKKLPLGQLPEERIIREAVVAIPFVEDASRKRQFFELPKNEVYKAVQNVGYPDYKKEEIARIERRNTKRRAKRNRSPRGRDSEITPLQVRPAIQAMVEKMLKYVIPPKMNFLKYNKEDMFVQPFAMYIFEFEHTLSKQDLAYMWQNLPPDVALDNFHNNDADTLKAESVVSHDLGGDTDLLSGRLDSDIKWMVFKIKQKAETNYFKKIDRDKLPAGHPDKIKSVEDDIFEYGFNWPYDYFSLVELIKIDAEVGFVKNADAADPVEPEEAVDIIRKAGLNLRPADDSGDDRPEVKFPFVNIIPKEDE